MSKTLKKTGATLVLVGVLALAAVAALTAAPAASAAPPQRATISSAISGTTASGATLVGTLTNMTFVNQAGNLALTGILNGTVTTATGTVPVVNQAVTLPVIGGQATGSCQILDLTLGPLDLNLLGLMVHLDTVHLNITAQRGPGNLLGNLLCAVAGLLDNTGGGNLANLLNRLLGL